MNHSLDNVIARNTGFSSMADMVNAGGRYRPSLDMREAWAREVADAYDAVQAARGDERRAYRYGEAKPAAPAKPAREATPFRKAKEAIAKARKEASREARLNPITNQLRWRRWRTPLIWAIDASGERLNGGDWTAWGGTWREIEKMIAANPGTVEVVMHSGIDCAANREDMECGDYEIVDMEVTLWSMA